MTEEQRWKMQHQIELDQGISRSVAVEKLKERLGTNYGIDTTDPIYKKKKFDKDDIVGGH